MTGRRVFSILAHRGGLVEHLPGEPEGALRGRVGDRKVVGRYTTTICNDCDEDSCTSGLGRPILEARNIFTIERLCNNVASGRWRLQSGEKTFHYTKSFLTKEDLVTFLEEMPDSWRGNVSWERWKLAVSSVRQILNVPRLRIVEKDNILS